MAGNSAANVAAVQAVISGRPPAHVVNKDPDDASSADD